MQTSLSLKSAKQTLDIPMTEIYGMTEQEVKSYILQKYVPAFVTLHSQVDISILGFIDDSIGRPER